MFELDPQELDTLVRRVFAPGEGDRRIALLVDLPDDEKPDRPRWEDRRRLALEWRDGLRAAGAHFRSIDLFSYPNVGANNADLPESARRCDAEPGDGEIVPFAEIFESHSILIAPTELSASAPLKLAAPRHGFRAASMPGFSREMVPALRLDFDDVHARCTAVRRRLDGAEAAYLDWRAAGREGRLRLDLRGRSAVASGGLIREPGTAANLPSGETYIVPYEGERPGDPSGTSGTLPLQLDGELMFLTVASNRAVAVEGTGPRAARQRAAFLEEPAFANVAELGLGLLGDYGVRAVGETLLDEKLGPHVAFGRSDHFPGGTVGPRDFSSPRRVAHVDYVYVPECQPDVEIVRIVLRDAGGDESTLLLNGTWNF